MRCLEILAIAAAVALSPFTASNASASPGESGAAWEAEIALEKARGALDRAGRADAMRYEFFETKEAWEAYRQARDAYRAGDYDEATVTAQKSARMAERAAQASAPDFAAAEIEAEKRALLTTVYANSDVVPLITDDGIELGYDGLFVPTTATLSARGHQVADLMAETARRHPTFRVVIEGYPRNSEHPTEALWMAQRQALALVDALKTRGVDASRLSSTTNDEPLSRVEGGADFVFVAPEAYPLN